MKYYIRIVEEEIKQKLQASGALLIKGPNLDKPEPNRKKRLILLNGTNNRALQKRDKLFTFLLR